MNLSKFPRKLWKTSYVYTFEIESEGTFSDLWSFDVPVLLACKHVNTLNFLWCIICICIHAITQQESIAEVYLNSYAPIVVIAL